MTRYVDMTPTWEEAARMLIAVLENGTSQGKALARAEIIRMGQIIDQYKKETTECPASTTP